MKRAIVLYVSIFLAGFLLSIAAFPGQDPPNRGCCFWIYSTGVDLGGLKSTAYFGGQSNATDIMLTTLMSMISTSTQTANQLCSELSPAWNNYPAIQRELTLLTNELQSIPPKTEYGQWPNYPRIYHALPAEKGEFEHGLLDVGRRLPQPPREEMTNVGFNCEVGYYLLGYYIGFALNAFQVAAQEPEQSPTAKKARQLGLEHNVRAVDLIYSLRKTFEGGKRCGRLWLDQFGILSTLQEVDQERAFSRLTNAQLAGRLLNIRYRIVQPDIFGPPAPECPPGGTIPGGTILPDDGGYCSCNWCERYCKKPEDKKGRDEQTTPPDNKQVCPSISGTWKRTGGGIWTIHQSGNQSGSSINWVGKSADEPFPDGKWFFYQEFKGTMIDDCHFQGRWEDIPQRSIMKNQGNIVLEVVSDKLIQSVSEYKGFKTEPNYGVLELKR